MILYYFVEFAGSFANIALLLLFIGRLFPKKEPVSKWFYVYVVLMIAGQCALSLFPDWVTQRTIYLLVGGFFLALLFYEVRPWQAVFASGAFFTLIALVEVLAMLLIGLRIPDTDILMQAGAARLVYVVFSNLIQVPLVVLISHFFSRKGNALRILWLLPIIAIQIASIAVCYVAQYHAADEYFPDYMVGLMFGRFIDDEKMYDWDSAYISQVLHSPVYAGHIIYEAKPTVSMKSKKRRYIPFEERAIVPNTHEAIIPQDRWENVQRILYSRSSSFMCDKTDYDNIFKGIVRCADCGRTMLVKVEHRRKRNSVLDQTFYCCSTYRKYGAKACDSHNLEARVLHEAVFADIQAHAKAAVSNREALVKKIANQMHLRVSSDRAQHKRDLKQCKARIAEIEDLYAKLYEDVSKGLLPEKRFQMLADRYDKEQAELTEKIEQYEREGRAEHDQLDKIQDFIDEVSKYAGITELNYKILHQLIDKILVSKAEKVDGEYVQKIQIFYRFIGPLDAIE